VHAVDSSSRDCPCDADGKQQDDCGEDSTPTSHALSVAAPGVSTPRLREAEMPRNAGEATA